jgi:hypothetical protein
MKSVVGKTLTDKGLTTRAKAVLLNVGWSQFPYT